MSQATIPDLPLNSFPPIDALFEISNTGVSQSTRLQDIVFGLQPTSEKNNANGYAGLDPSGLIFESQLPDISGTYQVISEKDIANGYAGLDATGLLLLGTIPQLPQTRITDLVTDLAARELLANKVTTIGTPGNDINYPTEKATRDALDLKQDTLLFTPEDIANKVTTVGTPGNDTNYPSEKAVRDALNLKQDTLLFTPEDIANKVTTIGTPGNDTNYPTEKAARDALDLKEDSLGFTPEDVANKAINLLTPDNIKYATTLAITTELSSYQLLSEKGAVSGYAGLDASQELLLANFPAGAALQFLRRNAGNTALEFAASGSVSPLTTKGDVYTYDTGDARLPVGADGFILSANSVQATGLEWIVAPVTSPLTTKGDLYTFDTVNQRLPVGTNGQFLVADSVEATGIKWITAILGITSLNADAAAAQTLTGGDGISITDLTPDHSFAVDATVARDADNLSFFSATTSAQLAGVISDETGTGLLVFGTAPVILTPTIASFVNAVHDHSNAAGGGQLTNTALIAGVFSAITGLGVQSQILNMGNFAIQALSPPTNGTDAATKTYVDDLVNGLAWKDAALVATTSNITLSGEQTIDGVLTSASRVLVKNQSSGQENGVYDSAAGAWTRTTDADTDVELVNMSIFIESGVTQTGTAWTQTVPLPITVDTTVLNYAQVGAGPANPLTTKGDLFGYDTENNRVPVGTNGQVLTANSAVALGLEWQTPTDGDVVGPVSSTDEAITLFDGITGKLIKNSNLIYDVSNSHLNLTGALRIIAGGSVPAGTETYLREVGSDLVVNVTSLGSILLNFGTANNYEFDQDQLDLKSNNLVNAIITSASTLNGTAVATAGLSYANGLKQTFNPSGANAGLNFGSETGDPSTTVEGDVWYNSTLNKFRANENGVDVDMIGGGGGSQTPWTSDIDADGFDLTDLSNIVFRSVSTADPGVSNSISLQTGVFTQDMHFHVASGTGQYHFFIGATTPADIIINNNSVSMDFKSLNGISGIRGTNDFKILDFVTLASSVNNLQISGAITGQGPLIESEGSDTNVDIRLSPKGFADGSVHIQSRALKMDEINTPTAPPAGDAKIYPKNVGGRSHLFIQDDVGEVDLQLALADTPWTVDHDAASFNLLNFGYLESDAINPSSTGAIRLGDTEQIMWRNNANNADIGIDVNNDIFNIINAVTITGSSTLNINFQSATANFDAVNANAFDVGGGSITSVLEIEFDPGGAILWQAGESISIQTGDMIFDVPTTDFFSFDIATVPEYTFSATQADFNGNSLINATITGATNTISGISEAMQTVAVGAAATVLTSNGVGVAPTYQAAAAGGDVVGPASALNHSLAVFDGVTGKLIDEAGSAGFEIIVDTAGQPTLPRNLIFTSFAVAPPAGTVGFIGNYSNVMTINGNTGVALHIQNVAKVNLTSADMLLSDLNIRIGTGFMEFEEITIPALPPANGGRLYTKDVSTVTNLFFLDSSGTETQITGVGGGSDTPWTEDHDAAGFDLGFKTASPITIGQGATDVLSITYLDDTVDAGIRIGNTDGFVSITNESAVVNDAQTVFTMRSGGATTIQNIMNFTVPIADDSGTVPYLRMNFEDSAGGNIGRPLLELTNAGTLWLEISNTTDWTFHSSTTLIDLQNIIFGGVTNTDITPGTFSATKLSLPQGTAISWDGAAPTTPNAIGFSTGDAFQIVINNDTQYQFLAAQFDVATSDITAIGAAKFTNAASSDIHGITGGIVIDSVTQTNFEIGGIQKFFFNGSFLDMGDLHIKNLNSIRGIESGTPIILKIEEVASAVEYLEITNAITGVGPTLSSNGTAGVVDLNIDTKGAGDINVLSYAVLDTNLQQKKGPNIASASSMAPREGNFFDVTGVITINYLVDELYWQAGSQITLQFDSALTLTHNAGTDPANFASMLLTGDVDFDVAAGDLITFVFDGVSWLEVSRASSTIPGIDLVGNDIDNIQNLIHDLSTSGTDVDFTEDQLQEISIAANTTFTGTGYAIGKSKTLKITTDATLRTLAFPAGWTFVGTKPTDQAASKEGILTLTCFTAAEAGVVAAYSVET